MSVWETISRADIERLAYLKNPRSAASYLGITPKEVERVWKSMKGDRVVHSAWQPRNESSGLNTRFDERDAAELGSAALCAAIKAYFRKWEKQNGFREGAGAILLPAGWRA